MFAQVLSIAVAIASTIAIQFIFAKLFTAGTQAMIVLKLSLMSIMCYLALFKLLSTLTSLYNWVTFWTYFIVRCKKCYLFVNIFFLNCDTRVVTSCLLTLVFFWPFAMLLLPTICVDVGLSDCAQHWQTLSKTNVCQTLNTIICYVSLNTYLSLEIDLMFIRWEHT